MVNTHAVNGSTSAMATIDDNLVQLVTRLVREANAELMEKIEGISLQQTALGAQREEMNGNNNTPQLQYARLSKVEFPQFNGDSEAITGKRNAKNKTKVDDKSHVHDVFDEMPKIRKPKQEGLIKEYYELFKSFVDRMGLGDSFAIRFFIEGFKPEVEREIRVFNPKTLREAQLLANLQEATIAFKKKKNTNSHIPMYFSSKINSSKEVEIENMELVVYDECEVKENETEGMGNKTELGVSEMDDSRIVESAAEYDGEQLGD